MTNPGPGLEQTQKYSEVDNWISNRNKYVKKCLKKKSVQISLHSKRPHTITEMNDNTNLDSTISGSMNTHS